MYLISSSDAVLVGHGSGAFAGEAIGVPTGTMFNQASLSGAAVISKTAQSTAGPTVDIATASADGKGTSTRNADRRAFVSRGWQ